MNDRSSELFGEKSDALSKIVIEDQQEHETKAMFWRCAMLCLFLAIVGAVVILLPFAQYSNGVRLCRRGEWKQAISQLESLKFKNSDEWLDYAIMSYGNELLYSQEYDAAIDQYKLLDNSQDMLNYIAHIRNMVSDNKNRVVNEQSMAQNEEHEENDISKTINVPEYMNAGVFEYFNLSKEDVANWDIYERSADGITNYSTYALNGVSHDDSYFFQNYEMYVQFCDPIESTEKLYPRLYYDVHGEEGTYVSAISVKANDVFPGFDETFTLKRIREALEKDFGDTDLQACYAYGIEGYTDICDIYRVEFMCNGYLFSMKVFEGINDGDTDLDSLPFDDAWSVYISDAKGGADYKELAGVYILEGYSGTFGEEDIERRTPINDTMMIIKKNEEGYSVTEYLAYPDESWHQIPLFDGPEMNAEYDDEMGRWTIYFTPDPVEGEKYIYNIFYQHNFQLEVAGDGDGAVYKKIPWEITAPIVMMTEEEIE